MSDEIICSLENEDTVIFSIDIILAIRKDSIPVTIELAEKLYRGLCLHTNEPMIWGTLASLLVEHVFNKLEPEFSIHFLELVAICRFTNMFKDPVGSALKAQEKSLEMLADLKSREARQALARVVRDSDSHLVTECAAGLLKTDCSGCEDILLQTCYSGLWYQKEAAAMALAATSSPDCEDALCHLLQSHEGHVAEIAAHSLRNYQGPQVRDALRMAMMSQMRDVPGIAAMALSKVGGEEELSNLSDALDDARCSNAEGIVKAIAMIGNENAFDILIDQLTKKTASDDVIRYTIEQLGKLHVNRSFPYIIQFIGYTNWIIRQTAVKAAAQISPQATYPYLIAALDDEVATVVEAAIYALGDIGNPDAIPALKKLLPPSCPIICEALHVVLKTLSH